MDTRDIEKNLLGLGLLDDKIMAECQARIELANKYQSVDWRDQYYFGEIQKLGEEMGNAELEQPFEGDPEIS